MTDQIVTHGVTAIAETFAQAKTEGRAAFMPYWMLGYPDLPTSIETIRALIDAGADAVEIGVPFSDPLADGVVIAAAAQVAIEQGTTLTDCLAAVRTLREGGAKVPFLMMSYVNPMLAYGLERFVNEATAVGVDGFIVPDLPPDEAQELLAKCEARQLALIELLAPTSNPQRIKLVAETARGFIYLVAVTGITGARETLSVDLEAYIARVRAATDLPLAVGFGVSKPEHVAQIKRWADGVIVASALIRESSNGIAAVRVLAASLRAAC